MNLVIDQGNTFTKIGIFDQDKQIYSDSYKTFDENLIVNLQNQFLISKVIISSVQKDFSKQDEFNNLFGRINDTKIHVLNNESKLPIKLEYKTPESLGKDRIAALVGSSSLFLDDPKLIIDAGTAITIDYLDKDNIFKGGNISPGIQTRFKALNYYTKQLPLLNINENSQFLGLSTNEAIWSGVQNGIVYEIDGYITNFKIKNKKIKVILTGGDADFLAKKLKNPIFVNRNIVLIGLNSILEFNT